MTSLSQRIVVIVGWAIVAIGLAGVARPEQFAMVLGWPPTVLLYVAFGVRVVLGVLFVLAAPGCRFPRFIAAIGVLALAAAVSLLLLGAGRLEALVNWWFQQSPPFLRAVYVADVVFGAALVYAGSRRRATAT